MKKWLMIQCAAVLITALLGQIGRSQFLDCGLMDIKSPEDAYANDFGINFIFGDNSAMGDTEDDLYHNLVVYEKEYIDDMDLAPVIVIGHATGNIVNYKDSLGQEIAVDRIVKGENLIETDRFFVYSVECFELNKDGGIVYSGLKNIMNTEDTYLIFLEPSELNEYTKEKTFILSGVFFNYLNLSRSSTHPITVPIEQIRASDLKDMEFFAGSQRMVDQLNDIKSRIISKYI